MMTWLRGRWWIWRHPFKSAAILRHLGDAGDVEGAQNGADALCHCGLPVGYGYDGALTHHRGMCENCDLVRCDAYPQDCPHRVPAADAGEGE